MEYENQKHNAMPPIELLRQYVFGELEEEKALMVQEQINQNPEANEFVIGLQKYQKKYDFSSSEEYLKWLKGRKERIFSHLENNFPPFIEARKKRRRNLVIVYGLGVLLIVSSLFLIIESTRKNNCSQLFVEYYRPFSVPDNRGANDVERNHTNENISFIIKSHPALIDSLREVNELDNVDFVNPLILGCIFLEVDSLKQAEAIFTATMKDSLLQSEALWYTALTHLKSNDCDQAASVLNQIISLEVGSQDRARILLDQIN